MVSLLVTESLEVVAKGVTVRENFHTGDMTVLDIGKHIPRPSWQGEGIVTEFGTLSLKERRVPCQWQRVRDIITARTEKPSRTGAELVDDNQRIYLPIFGMAPAALTAPPTIGRLKPTIQESEWPERWSRTWSMTSSSQNSKMVKC